MAKYTVVFIGGDGVERTETVEAGSFKTPSHTSGPVTFYSGSYSRSNDNKVAHYNRVVSVRHETLDVDNSDRLDEGESDDDMGKGDVFGE